MLYRYYVDILQLTIFPLGDAIRTRVACRSTTKSHAMTVLCLHNIIISFAIGQEKTKQTASSNIFVRLIYVITEYAKSMCIAHYTFYILESLSNFLINCTLVLIVGYVKQTQTICLIQQQIFSLAQPRLQSATTPIRVQPNQ